MNKTIENLKKLKSFHNGSYGADIDKAIKALEQEPCEDAIDRAEAMTEIMMFAGNVKSDEEDIYIKVSDAVQLLRELPLVTPKGVTVTEFADRCRECGREKVLEKIREEIEQLPSVLNLAECEVL